MNTPKEIYYEDIMDSLEDKNKLRFKLINLVRKYTNINVIGLESKYRYYIYRQMYYPLKFKKEKKDDEVTIKIWNYKIKNNNFNVNENNESNLEKFLDVEISSEKSYDTNIEEFEERTENMLSIVLENNNNILNQNNSILFRINLMIYLNMLGWILVSIFDPVRLIVTYPENLYKLKSDVC